MSNQRSFIPWYKRSYLVNRDLQFRYGMSAIIIGIVSSSLSVGQVLWAFRVFHIWQGQRLPPPVLLGILMVLLMNVVLIFAGAVLMTHKIAGPIFNLLRQIEKFGDGDLSVRAKFRSNDELQNVANAFNKMADNVQDREAQLQRKIDDALQALEVGDMNRARSVLASPAITMASTPE